MVAVNKHQEAGQSTVEFALMIMLLMGVTLFYVQVSLVMGFGNYVHYATFMAARAFLSGAATTDMQTTAAKNVIISTLKLGVGQPNTDRWSNLGIGIGGGDPTGFLTQAAQFNPSDPDYSWMQGGRYTFKSRLFMIPLSVGGPSNGSVNSVTLTAESWLGREPTDQDCSTWMSKRNGAYFDNGC